MSGVAPAAPWIQVLGRVAVHQDGTAKRLTDSGQRLVSVLVAAGPNGATAERIAEEIWGNNQPNPWRPALRMAVTRLRKRLPQGWDIVADGGSYRITTADGWIDAWRLEEQASSPAAITEQDLEWMLAGPPFGELDLLEMVAASTQTLQLLQVTIAQRYNAQAPTEMLPATCSLLTSLMRSHPYNDRLALEISGTLRAAGRRNEALVALQIFADSFVAEIGDLPEDIREFLVSGGASANQVAPTGPAHEQPLELAKELRHLLELPMLGRHAELVDLLCATGGLVVGPAGSGKSRLFAEVLATDEKRETVYVVGDDRLTMPLGPFAAALPALRDELLALGDDVDTLRPAEQTPHPTTSSTAWRLVLGYLETQSEIRPQRLIVDDAHLLDPVSLGLLRLLIRSNTVADLAIVVAGRNDFEDVGWADLLSDAERAGLQTIELAGLTQADLEQMVFERFPAANLQLRQSLATEVFEASGGLPAVAAPLISSADQDTLVLPEHLAGLPALSRVTASLSDRAPEVLAAAAVLGHQFSIGAVMELADLDESVVFSVLDELWSANLIVETDDPDQVRFRHVLIQRAFLEGVPLFRRGRLHLKAANLTKDPHQIADHQVNAGTLVAPEVVAQSLLTSARRYADRQLWRRVTREFRRLEELPGEYLDASAHSLWATALEYSGSDGAAQRRTAYDMAMNARDWSGALDAALSGLPKAERPDGDRERIAMMEAIPGAGLGQPERFTQLANLSRQYSLLGSESAHAFEHAEAAMKAANDPDEVGLAYALQWAAGRHHREGQPVVPSGFADADSLPIRLRIAQITAINLAEAGDFDAAKEATKVFHQLAVASDDAYRLWNAQALQCLFLVNDGAFAEANVMALKNREFADTHGIQQGAVAHVGHQVFIHECQLRLAELHAELEPFRANLEGLIAGRTALAMCAQAATDADISAEVRAIVQDAVERGGGTMSVLSLLFLSGYVNDLAPDLALPARRILERFGDSPVLASFAGVSFGPTVRYVALLARDHDEKADLTKQSILAADRHGTRLWRVRTRLDFALLCGGASLNDAREIAKGSELEAVVERFCTRHGLA